MAAGGGFVQLWVDWNRNGSWLDPGEYVVPNIPFPDSTNAISFTAPPDAYTGEKPKAFVTLEKGGDVTGEDLANWLNPQLGKHEQVQTVVVRDELPKTMIGKLDRKALRAEEGEG